ncbi:hypothetical protein C484_10421 [Natrialba taiwanensis DSM 12281]|uniref:Small CPxCG-related zinc finger protein n=1 Tax=Natrialba taiwanensis DSM 12281 TaxID=1230458 RepID=L9ZY46_9EURY|nr:hypothetical protein C484_10421 [Natrialba taiwanensis DSM 12281]
MWTSYSADTKPDTECRNCGSHIIPQTARVIGDEFNNVHACPECTTYRELPGGDFL